MYKSEVYGEGNIFAKVVADSEANGIRLTTMELNYPRFIHSEVMTHRMFSRNASSSRAIPVARMIEQVENNPAMPIHWGKNQKGMQASEEWEGKLFVPAMGTQKSYETTCPSEYWQYASKDAIRWAGRYAEAGLHKQVVNRILEPFQFIKVVVTATEWDNFFNLRLHPDAQPEIQELARCMWEAIYQSEPTDLSVGGWHLPYTDAAKYDTASPVGNYDLEEAIKASVARCARVSYMNHDNTSPIIEKDIALHDQLLEAGHMSPFEHVATPIGGEVWFYNNGSDPVSWQKGITHSDRQGNLWSGNIRGWIQYRQLVERT